MFNFLRDIAKTAWNLGYAMYDLVTLVLPQHRPLTGFAFLVHPRDITDIYRPYPAFRYLPDKFVLWFVKFLPPITLSKITGVKSVKTGEVIKGYLLSIVLSPYHMKKDLPLVKRRIRQLSILAQKKGCNLIGLGALLPFLTKYGEDLKEYTQCHITTGHAYTATAIVKDVYVVAEALDVELSKSKIAIVGAAGSVGGLCAKTIIRMNGIKNLILLDVRNKQQKLQALRKEIKDFNNQLNVEVGADLFLLKEADIVIVVTNATTTIIKPEMLKRGTVVIDDSQPRNTVPELMEQHGIIVIDVLGKYNGLNCHFDFGLLKEQPDLAFTCLIETAILASHEWDRDFCIGEVGFEYVQAIAGMAKEIGVESGKIILTSFSKEISIGDVLANKVARSRKTSNALLTFLS